MERAIKFRAWHCAENAMHQVRCIDYVNKLISLGVYGIPAQELLKLEDVVLMQFIGYGYKGDYETKHHNRVELYEGDIVEAWSQGSKRIFQIKYRNNGNPEYILYPAYQEGKFWSMSFTEDNGIMVDDLKLIGNIYENPELIPKSH